MATEVDRGVLTLSEYRYPGEKYGCCLRLSMPCSPRHADVHLVAHILSHEMTLSVPELDRSFGRPHGGWSKFLRENAAMLAFADVQVIEWGVGKGARVAAFRLPKNPQWFHFAEVWIKRISAKRSLKMSTFDAGRWVGMEPGDVVSLVSQYPFDFAEVGLTLSGGGKNAHLHYEVPECLAISNAGYEMTDGEKHAEKERLFKVSGICQGCGSIELTADRLSLDRVFPGRLGGRYVEGNCQLLCTSCNSRKSTRTMSYLWEVLASNGNEFAKSRLESVAKERQGLTKRLMMEVLRQRWGRP